MSADGMFPDDVQPATWTFKSFEDMVGKENARREYYASRARGWGPSHDWSYASSDQHWKFTANQVLMYSIEAQAEKTIYSPNIFRGYVNNAVKGVLAKANWAHFRVQRLTF